MKKLAGINILTFIPVLQLVTVDNLNVANGLIQSQSKHQDRGHTVKEFMILIRDKCK